MYSFKRFNEEKLPARKYFSSSTKKGKIDADGKISDGQISIEDYLTCEKIWNKFRMKNMGDYHDHYLKKTYYCWLMYLKSLLKLASNIMNLILFFILVLQDSVGMLC